MAKIPSGILGGIRGKVGGAVGGNWRGVNYIRAYSKPGYSRTDAQGSQRDNMAYLVAASKPFVNPVDFTYFNKFLPRLSGFNWRVRENMAAKLIAETVTSLKVCAGPLYPGSGLTGEMETSSFVLAWAVGNGVDGADTDVAVGWVRNPATNECIFGVPITRAALSMTIIARSGLTATQWYAGLFFARMNEYGDVCQRISTNMSVQCTAA